LVCLCMSGIVCFFWPPELLPSIECQIGVRSPQSKRHLCQDLDSWGHSKLYPY
jgi:hypothetical protein